MSKQNLINDEAKAKLTEMANNIDFTLMATGLDKAPFHTIPMSTKVGRRRRLHLVPKRTRQHPQRQHRSRWSSPIELRGRWQI